MIMTMYKDIKLSVTNNGYGSQQIKLERGLLQGNAIAGYCFILLIETLAIQLRHNTKIEGIKIKDQRFLLSQFADDLSLYLKFKQSTWNEVLNEFLLHLRITLE